MARYQIWDKVSRVIVPTGKVYEANEWSDKYPMSKIDGIKLVIAGGTINGAVCMEYTQMVENYEKMGCDFSECVTDQDYLNAIEAFEDEMNKPSDEISIDERIAAALEAQVVLASMDLDDEEIE